MKQSLLLQFLFQIGHRFAGLFLGRGQKQGLRSGIKATIGETIPWLKLFDPVVPSPDDEKWPVETMRKSRLESAEEGYTREAWCVILAASSLRRQLVSGA